MQLWLIGGLLLILAADAAFLFFWIPRLVDRKLEHFQSDLMDRHYDEVENMYRTMRGWRHDYHNHIQAMKAYAQLGKYEELIAYLGRLDENLYQVDTVIKTGNLMMDAVLGSKLALMKKKRIRTDVTVRVPKRMKLTASRLPVARPSSASADFSSKQLKNPETMRLSGFFLFRSFALFWHSLTRFEPFFMG